MTVNNVVTMLFEELQGSPQGPWGIGGHFVCMTDVRSLSDGRCAVDLNAIDGLGAGQVTVVHGHDIHRVPGADQVLGELPGHRSGTASYGRKLMIEH